MDLPCGFKSSLPVRHGKAHFTREKTGIEVIFISKQFFVVVASFSKTKLLILFLQNMNSPKII